MRARAAGLCCLQAVIGLLIGHRRWLSGGRLPCSDGASGVLRIAVSIAEGVAVDLRECLSTLDDASIGPVVDVVRRAGGRATASGVGVDRGERP